MTKRFWQLSLLAMIMLAACGRPALYENQQDFESGSWLESDLVSFDFKAPAQTVQGELQVHIRVSADYPHHNFYFKYLLKKEDGTVLGEALENRNLFDPVSGRPLGKGSGDIKEVSFVLIESQELNAGEAYTLELRQYMRINELPGIYSVGMSLYDVATAVQ